MNESTCCPRCSHHNPPRAKYCANCGLRLPIDAADAAGQAVRPHRHRAGMWLIILLILLAGAMLALALRFRQTAQDHIRRRLWPEIHQQQVIIHERTTSWETDPHDHE